MAQDTTTLFRLSFSVIFLLFFTQTCSASNAGSWKLLQKSIGIVAMHMQLLYNDRVVIFDRTDFGRSNLSLPRGKCRNDPNELALKFDCTAHSAEYDVSTNSFRPLIVQTDVWCSSGSVMSDGRLIQTGGFNDGELKVRTFSPCFSRNCDWLEMDGLKATRWYATNHLLPNGVQIVIGGRSQFNYEFYPKNNVAPNFYSLPFLEQTNDPDIENNLYPFVFLNVDGNLFIFANNQAILFNYRNSKVVKYYPKIPGGDPRSYPSTGSAAFLPLKNLRGGNIEAEVLICGGAPKNAFIQALKGNLVKALDTCGRIKITDPNPEWVMETMPRARVMGDMILLPNGRVLIINGGAAGAAGWELGRNPVLNPVVYHPDHKIGSRFELQNPSNIPRMYHSTAILLRDGRVLVGGSNPHDGYYFANVLFPTELSLEAFYPPYLGPEYNNLRPTIISPATRTKIGYGQNLSVRFKVHGMLQANMVHVTMMSPSFNTHSFSMNQRLLVLGNDKITNVGISTFEVQVVTPSSGNLAPSGFYMLFVVHQDIPSEGIWVKIS